MFRVSSKRIFVFCETVERLCGEGFFRWRVVKPILCDPCFDLAETCETVFNTIGKKDDEYYFEIELFSTNHFLHFNGTVEDVAFRKWIPPLMIDQTDENNVEDEKLNEVAKILVKHFKQDHNDYLVFVKIDKDLSDKEALKVAKIMSKYINLTGYYRDDDGTDWFKVENQFSHVPFVMSLQDRVFTNEVWLSLHLTKGFLRKKEINNTFLTSPSKMTAPNDLMQLFKKWEHITDKDGHDQESKNMIRNKKSSVY